MGDKVSNYEKKPRFFKKKYILKCMKRLLAVSALFQRFLSQFSLNKCVESLISHLVGLYV